MPHLVLSEVTTAGQHFSSTAPLTGMRLILAAHDISTVKLYLMADGIIYGPPNAFTIDYYDGKQWLR